VWMYVRSRCWTIHTEHLTRVCTVCWLYCRYVLSKCERLTELSVDLGEGQLDLETIDVISTHCRELQVLHLYGLEDNGFYSTAKDVCFKITNRSVGQKPLASSA